MLAGIAKRKITPLEPMYLDGQGSRIGKSRGVLDDIYVTAMVVMQDETYLWLSYEFVDMQRIYSDEIMERTAKCLKIARDHVIVSFTHTHSAPCLQLDPLWSFRYAPKETADYREAILVKTLEAAETALRESQECEMYCAVKTIEGCYGNRNGLELPGDQDVQLVQFRHDENIVAAIVNMACHPTVLGPSNYAISGDLFGRLRNQLNKAWNSEVFMMQGAAGDMGNRQYRKGEDDEELKRISTAVCAQLLNDISWQRMSEEPCRMHRYHHAFSVSIDKTHVDDDLAKVSASLHTPGIDRDQKKLLLTMQEWYEKLYTMPDHMDITFDGWFFQLGKVLIITIPGELNSCFALQLRDRLRSYQCLIWGYVYYSNGYLVESSEYGKHFESIVSLVPKGKSEAYMEFLGEELNHWLM